MTENKRNKMSQDRRHSFRLTMQGLPCGTCGLPVCWSLDTDDKAAWKATFGHVKADCIGGKAGPLNGIVQCWACNWSAKKSERWDLTADIIVGSLRAWMPSKVALALPDPREVPPAQGLPDWQARKAARKARGLTW